MRLLLLSVVLFSGCYRSVQVRAEYRQPLIAARLDVEVVR